MNETLFYVLGLALVIGAVAVTVIGVRFENFPTSRGLLVGGTAVFATLVVATATLAWLSAEDEQEHREAELAHAEQENLEEGDVGEAQEEGATTVTTSTTTTASVDGAQVFADNNCGGCHTLADAGTTGNVGPVLDSTLQGESPEFIETSIVDPNAVVEEGFPPDTMPDDYGQLLSPEELDALVQYLSEATG